MSTTATRRAAVWDLMRDGEWHTTMEVCAVDIGGSEGCRRLRELRQEIHRGKRPGFKTILMRRCTHGRQYEYCLEPLPTPKKKPGKRR